MIRVIERACGTTTTNITYVSYNEIHTHTFIKITLFLHTQIRLKDTMIISFRKIYDLILSIVPKLVIELRINQFPSKTKEEVNIHNAAMMIINVNTTHTSSLTRCQGNDVFHLCQYKWCIVVLRVVGRHAVI